jgi:hypothetical protein
MDDLSGYAMKVVADPALFRKDEPRTLIGSPSRLEACCEQIGRAN